MTPDLSEYKAAYTRISDGREFLCRLIVPGTCKMYDTVLKTFEEMSTTKRALYFKRKVGHSYPKPNRKVSRVSGAKVRELRKKGIDVIGGKGNWE